MAQDSFAGVSLPRSPVYGTRHMVTSGHSLASLAGNRAFERGGSVIDAMIATSAVLSVVVPQATSLGSDANAWSILKAVGRAGGRALITTRALAVVGILVLVSALALYGLQHLLGREEESS